VATVSSIYSHSELGRPSFDSATKICRGGATSSVDVGRLNLSAGVAERTGSGATSCAIATVEVGDF
jgi:hypothetical protein